MKFNKSEKKVLISIVKHEFIHKKENSNLSEKHNITHHKTKSSQILTENNIKMQINSQKLVINSNVVLKNESSEKNYNFMMAKHNLTENHIEINQNYYPIINSKNRENIEHAICDVCLENPSNSKIIICNFCFSSVHQKCYGSSEIICEYPKSQWICERCRYLKQNNYNPYHIRCFFCPQVKGILKKITKDKWSHISCVNWTSDVHYLDPIKKDFVDLKVIKADKFGIVCHFCNHTLGACIRCDFEECDINFHVKCAQDNHLIQSRAKMLKYYINGVIPVFCTKHKEDVDRNLQNFKSDFTRKKRFKLKINSLKKRIHLKEQSVNKGSLHKKTLKRFRKSVKKIKFKNDNTWISSRSLKKIKSDIWIDIEVDQKLKRELDYPPLPSFEKKYIVKEEIGSFLNLSSHKDYSLMELSDLFIGFCLKNNILDIESGNFLLFRNDSLKLLFEREFIKKDDILNVLEEFFTKHKIISSERLDNQRLFIRNLHSLHAIKRRCFFRKVNMLKIISL